MNIDLFNIAKIIAWNSKVALSTDNYDSYYQAKNLEFEERIRQQVSGITCNPGRPLKLERKNYKTIIRPIVMYESKCWATNETVERKLHMAACIS